MGEEREERDLDPRVVEHAGRREEQHQEDHRVALVGRGGEDQRLGDEAAEQGKGGDRGRADDAEGGGPGHGLVEPAQVRAVDVADPMEHRAHRHEQKRLIDDVGEGVRRRAVDGQFGADADAADHEAQLVVEAVGENPPEVVHDHRVEDRKGRHGGADVNQDLGPRVAPGKRIDGELGGEGAEPDGAAHRGLGIGVLQPVVQEREGAFDADGEEDQGRPQAAEAHGAELDRARVRDVEQGAGQQQDTRAHLDDEIA